MQAEILLTLKLQERLFADPRRINLLKQIEQTGSISQGAKNANISYKSAWDAINEMNQLSEQTLVERATGEKAAAAQLSPATVSVLFNSMIYWVRFSKKRLMC
jgi:molybdate transport system regulatory protein